MNSMMKKGLDLNKSNPFFRNLQKITCIISPERHVIIVSVSLCSDTDVVQQCGDGTDCCYDVGVCGPFQSINCHRTRAVIDDS